MTGWWVAGVCTVGPRSSVSMGLGGLVSGKWREVRCMWSVGGKRATEGLGWSSDGCP